MFKHFVADVIWA